MLAKHFPFSNFVELCFDCIENGQYCAIENLQIIISSAHEIQANIDFCLIWDFFLILQIQL